MAVSMDGSQKRFIEFMRDYEKFIHTHVPGEFDCEYIYRLYMLPVHRHLEMIVSQLPDGARILDVGCGRGHYSAYLSSRGLKTEGIDVINPRPLDDLLLDQKASLLESYPDLWSAAHAEYGGNYQYYDGHKFPFPDQSFDAVLFYAAYEHVPVTDIRQVTMEAYRVLRPGGKVFIFRCPSRLAWKEHLTRWLGMPGHVKLYAKKEITGLLREAGLTPEHFERSDFFPAFIIRPGCWSKQGAVWDLLRRGQRLVNLLAPFLLLMEIPLRWTPLRLFFQHFEMTARKSKS